MNRRELITLLGGAAAAWPLAARAQQAERVRRIGLLQGLAESDPETQARTVAFRQALEALGWTEGRPAGWVVRHRRGVLVGQHHHVQTILRHVDSAKREHLRIPSLLMRARAQATVRVWKKRLERQAHSRVKIRSACGLPVATGVRS
jgi:hypothetical protein